MESIALTRGRAERLGTTTPEVRLSPMDGSVRFELARGDGTVEPLGNQRWLGDGPWYLAQAGGAIDVLVTAQGASVAVDVRTAQTQFWVRRQVNGARVGLLRLEPADGGGWQVLVSEYDPGIGPSGEPGAPSSQQARDFRFKSVRLLVEASPTLPGRFAEVAVPAALAAARSVAGASGLAGVEVLVVGGGKTDPIPTLATTVLGLDSDVSGEEALVRQVASASRLTRVPGAFSDAIRRSAAPDTLVMAVAVDVPASSIEGSMVLAMCGSDRLAAKFPPRVAVVVWHGEPDLEESLRRAAKRVREDVG